MRGGFAAIATASVLAVFTVSAEAEVVTPQVVTPQVVTPEVVEPVVVTPRVVAPAPSPSPVKSPSAEAGPAPEVAPEPTPSQSAEAPVSSPKAPTRTPTGNGPNGRPRRPEFPPGQLPTPNWSLNVPYIHLEAAIFLLGVTIGFDRPVDIVGRSIAQMTDWNLWLGGYGGGSPPPVPMPSSPINVPPPDRMNTRAGPRGEAPRADVDPTKDPNVLEDSELKTPSGQRFGDENPTWEE